MIVNRSTYIDQLIRSKGNCFRKLLIVGEHTKPWSDDDGIQIISIYDFLLDLSSTD